MINFKDLELGNWINVRMNDSENHYGKVVKKDTEKISVLLIEKNETVSIDKANFIDGLRGIPILEGILIKCSFQPNSNDRSFIKYKGNEEIVVKDLGSQGWGLKINYPLLNTDNSCFSNLYELHKLQNLYNELTEEKLILNL